MQQQQERQRHNHLTATVNYCTNKQVKYLKDPLEIYRLND